MRIADRIAGKLRLAIESRGENLNVVLCCVALRGNTLGTYLPQ